MDAIATLRDDNDELRERIRQLIEQLASTTFIFPRELGLTPTQTVIVRHILSRDVITRQSTMMLLYAGRAGEDPRENNIDIQISKIRRKLKPHGIEIENVWGRGWRVLNREAVAARFK